MQVIREPRISSDNEWTLSAYSDDGDILEFRFGHGELWIEFLGSLRTEGRIAYFTAAHVQGPGANMLGVPLLRELAQLAKVLIDVDTIKLEGAVRSTGSTPKRRPKPLIF